MLVQLVLRKFLLLENVGSILSASCRDCMDYIMEVWSPTPLKKISACQWTLAGCQRTWPQSFLEFGHWPWCWSTRWELGFWVVTRNSHNDLARKINLVDLDFSPTCILPAGGSGIQLFWGLVLNERLLTSCWKIAATGSSGLFRPEPEAPARRVFEIMAAKALDEITKETATTWMAHESPLWRL